MPFYVLYNTTYLKVKCDVTLQQHLLPSVDCSFWFHRRGWSGVVCSRPVWRPVAEEQEWLALMCDQLPTSQFRTYRLSLLITECFLCPSSGESVWFIFSWPWSHPNQMHGSLRTWSVLSTYFATHLLHLKIEHLKCLFRYWIEFKWGKCEAVLYD